jgi:hypothetical protein
MVQSLSKLTTLEEFLTLPETKPASEYMGGQVGKLSRSQCPRESTALFKLSYLLPSI